MSKVLYRYEIHYTNWDGDTEICLREFPVIRETKRTYFIDRDGYTSKLRRVSKDGDEFGFNSYAYSDKQNAKDHFIRRTKKRISWLEFWTKECKRGIELIEEQPVNKSNIDRSGA